MNEHLTTWLTVRISETESDGVDPRALSRLLVELSNSMLAGARFALGDRRKRRGPPTESESRLAGLRITSVSQGSVVLQCMRPPGFPIPPPRLPGLETENVDPDRVAELVLDALQASGEGREIEPGNEPLRRSTRRFLEAAAKIGNSCDFDLHGLSTRHHLTVPLGHLSVVRSAAADQREVALYGHVYMADVELGRQRLRIKLPNDSDATMEIVPELRDSLLELLDKPVLLRVTETLRKGFLINRTVKGAQVLPPRLLGTEKPPKSLVELAAAQGLLSQPAPDYRSLASDVWQTHDEVEEALVYAEGLRKASA